LGQEELLGVLVECPTLLSGHNELADEASPVTDVIILVVLGQVEDVLGQQLALRQGTCSGPASPSPLGKPRHAVGPHPWYLLGVGQVQLSCQVDDLQLDDVLLIGEGLGHLAQHVRCDLGHVLAVLADEPQDAGPRHWHLQNMPGHVALMPPPWSQGPHNAPAHLDVIGELGHVLDDLAVLGWLHLQQLFDDHHGFGHHQLCGQRSILSRVLP